MQYSADLQVLLAWSEFQPDMIWTNVKQIPAKQVNLRCALPDRFLRVCVCVCGSRNGSQKYSNLTIFFFLLENANFSKAKHFAEMSVQMKYQIRAF